jgi:hypothetical protein
LIKLLQSLFGMMMPPSDPATRWQYIVSMTLLALAGLGGFHVAWACGWVNGLEGFALAVELEDQQESIDQILSRMIATQVEEARQAQCAAIESNNDAAVRGWSSTLTRLLAEYENEAGRSYALRACSEY